MFFLNRKTYFSILKMSIWISEDSVSSEKGLRTLSETSFVYSVYVLTFHVNQTVYWIEIVVRHVRMRLNSRKLAVTTYQTTYSVPNVAGGSLKPDGSTPLLGMISLRYIEV